MNALSPQELRLTLMASAPIGILVALGAVAYLAVLHEVETLVFTTVPDALGQPEPADWYLIAALAVGGLLTALAVTALPGSGGHDPLDGLGGPPAQPRTIVGVLLAALASLGFGAVLGPEAPLLALGTAIGLLAARTVGLAGQPALVIASAGAFGALSALLGGPLVAAILVLELAVVRRSPLAATIPGLLAASLGYLVFAGTNRWAGTPAPSFALDVPTPDSIGVADMVGGVVAAIAVTLLLRAVTGGAGRFRERLAGRPPLVVTPLAGVGIAISAIVFAAATDLDPSLVLFSGQAAGGQVITDGPGWGVAALLALAVAKAVAYALSLAGGFRGGPIFPAILIGTALGTAAAALPGTEAALTAAMVIAAASTAVVKLPYTSMMLAVLLVGASPEVMVMAGLGAVIGVVLQQRSPAAEPVTADDH